MLIGPLFTREMAVAARRLRNYAARAVYVVGLFGIAATAWLVLAGTQIICNPGDMARFGGIVFQWVAALQVVLAGFFSAVMGATGVAQEKDRRTLELLLLSRLSNHELVLGKLLASVLNMLVLLGAGVPVFLFMSLWGGISIRQVTGCVAVTAATVLLCGSLGTTLAFWREKTLQSLAMTVLALVLWVAFWEVVAAGVLGSSWWGISTGQWAAMMSPWRAILVAIQPLVAQEAFLGLWARSVVGFLAIATSLAGLLNAMAILGLRRWNPPQSIYTPPAEEDVESFSLPEPRDKLPRGEFSPAEEAVLSDSTQESPILADSSARLTKSIAGRRGCKAVGRSSDCLVWDNPIIWREICTWAYGRKILWVKAVYWILWAGAAVAVFEALQLPGGVSRWGMALPLVSICLLSLLLVNAQAVISMTTERDAGSLDLLLVSDLRPAEIIFGKLGGVWYNCKDMILLPLLLWIGIWWSGLLRLENLLYLSLGLLVLFGFVSVLGLHTGMTFPNSRTAIATSLGTVFFLFVGVAVCMMIMVAFSGSFHAQLQPFLAIMVGGGLGLYAVMGFRTPSAAKALAAFGCPLATFYAITSFLLGYTLGVFLVVVGAYGFATAALLVPVLAEFDVATGRTTAD